VLAGSVLLFFGFLAFVFGSLVEGPGAAIAGFVLVLIGIALLAFAGTKGRRTIPPPPPIQPPAGQRAPGGAAELACPNCGAPPGQVDRFGIALCGYCGTRFLVR